MTGLALTPVIQKGLGAGVVSTATDAISSGVATAAGEFLAETAFEHIKQMFGSKTAKQIDESSRAGLDIKKYYPHVAKELESLAKKEGSSVLNSTETILDAAFDEIAEKEDLPVDNIVESALLIAHTRGKLDYLDAVLPGGLRTAFAILELGTTNKELLRAAVVGTKRESLLDEILGMKQYV